MSKADSEELLTAYQTRASLLLRLKKQGDDQSWREFYGIYGRMIFGYALRYRLSHAEAEDIVQDVCIKMFRQILSFDYCPDQGHFRGWLKTVTKHAVIDFIRRKSRRSGHMDQYTEHMEILNTEKVDESDLIWQHEWEKAVFNAALLRVYSRIGTQCRDAFHLFVIEGIPANEVAERLSIKANAIYACKHRILRMIREEVETLRDEM